MRSRTVNKYQDKWGRFHHKPCINGEPSSNNGWIYTAYTQKVGVPVDENKLIQCWCECWTNQEHFACRNPNQPLPPFSRDEILGAVELKVLQSIWLESHNWNFSPYPLPKFSAVKLIKQLWQLRPSWKPSVTINTLTKSSSQTFFEFKHRNYFWQNNLDQLYRFAFSVPLQDRYFILQKWNSFKWYKPSHILYLTIAKIDAKLSPSGIRWLKYCPYPSKYFKEGPYIKAMVEEFPEDHPIRVKLGL